MPVKEKETPLSGRFVSQNINLFLAQMDRRHVDGHDYMWAVSEMIDGAEEAIFILVCTITP